jgi:hypothetical protein
VGAWANNEKNDMSITLTAVSSLFGLVLQHGDSVSRQVL